MTAPFRTPPRMPATDETRTSPLKREALLFAIFGLAGLLLLPGAVFLVGQAIFGDYGGGSYFDFHAGLLGRLLSGEPAVLFLLLSPYFVWQAVRLGFRLLRQRPAA